MKRPNLKRQTKTDWAMIDAMKDEEIDYSDNPKLGPEFFKNAIWWPGPKKQITLRLDPDILAFFRKHGRGYQTTINSVLRNYVDAQKRRAS
ncbi:MAG: BrnA antitoxin family protein [Terriglobia bacterium]